MTKVKKYHILTLRCPDCNLSTTHIHMVRYGVNGGDAWLKFDIMCAHCKQIESYECTMHALTIEAMCLDNPKLFQPFKKED